MTAITVTAWPLLPQNTTVTPPPCPPSLCPFPPYLPLFPFSTGLTTRPPPPILHHVCGSLSSPLTTLFPSQPPSQLPSLVFPFPSLLFRLRWLHFILTPLLLQCSVSLPLDKTINFHFQFGTFFFIFVLLPASSPRTLFPLHSLFHSSLPLHPILRHVQKSLLLPFSLTTFFLPRLLFPLSSP